MINKILLGLLFIINLQDVTFYKKLLTDFSNNSYYVFAVIASEGKENEIIVPNLDLYDYFKYYEKMSKKQYCKKLTRILSKQEKLIFKTPTNNHNFLIVNYNEEVENISKKGKEYFLKYYFNSFNYDSNYYLKNNIDEQKQRYIIKKLFQWRILISRSCETGSLIITP